MTVIAKISGPRLPEGFPRERLFHLLDRAMERPEVWVSAPAGSGKTTLIANWLDARKLPSLWYQVDAGDGDIATFFYYMGLAAKKAAPRHREPLPLLTSEYQMGISTFARRYFEKLFSCMKPPCLIVFDNYQELPADSPLHEVIRDGMSAVPPGVNVIFISRAAPPPVMATLKAERSMMSLGWEEIRLTLEETDGMIAFLNKKRVSSESLYLIHETAQGWAAGVILMTECLVMAADTLSVPVKGEWAEIFDYFAHEILAKTTPLVRDFLVKTSLLPKMTVSMAERLTGLDRSEEILSHLLRNNYFTQKHPQGSGGTLFAC